MANELTEKMVIRIKELEKRLSALERAEYAAGGVSLPWHPLTPPPELSAFTWVNQGTATASRIRDYINFVRPVTSARNVSVLVRNAPTPPYKLTLAISMFLSAKTGYTQVQMGFGWRDSSSGKITLACPKIGFSPFEIWVVNWDSPTSGEKTAATSIPYFLGDLLIWIRLVDDGTNRSVYFGLDYEDLSMIYSVSRTKFLTPTQLAFGGTVWDNSGSTVVPVGYLNLHSWLVEPL